MPKPRVGEKKSKYVKRTLKTIKKENPDKSLKAMLGQAYGMFEHYKNKFKKKKK